VRASYPDLALLVVDDLSPDGTGEIVKRLMKEFRDLELHTPASRRGLANAYLEGFQWALDNVNLPLLIQMDADLSHNPSDLSHLLMGSESADLVVGSRYVSGGKIIGWPRSRQALSSVGNRYAQLLLGNQVHDWTGGFNLWKRELLRAIPVDALNYKGYFFQVAMKYHAHLLDAKIKEIPITFTERQYGESKLHLSTVGEAWINMWKIRHIKKSS
jgi:dolichol-phosphate mannosyltransferase